MIHCIISKFLQFSASAFVITTASAVHFAVITVEHLQSLLHVYLLFSFQSLLGTMCEDELSQRVYRRYFSRRLSVPCNEYITLSPL